jgi:preprotein translocase subunit SecA
MKLMQKLFGSDNDRILKRYQRLVVRINQLEPEMQKLQDEDFPKKTEEYKQRLQNGETLDDLLPEAYALVREAAQRVIGERHYDVQMIGGIALHEGNIAEMQTGEGKTLSSTCPVYLNALTGKGVHIITPNDYLARRDSNWMGQIYRFLGMSTGLIQHGHSDQNRRANYECDITYGTNNEFGFDYLRDNMKYALQDYVQREFNYAVIDEVDSILIDEARTPLIISGPTEDNVEKYYVINKLVHGLSREIRREEVPKLPPEQQHDIDPKWAEKEDNEVVRVGDYGLDEKSRGINLTERGAETMEERVKHLLQPETSLFDYENMEVLHHINQALKAHYTFRRDVDYVVQNGQVVIVDEFTGRLMPGRRFSDGLHQALEAKEGVKIERENQTLATITFQNYFRLYSKLSGMTGTAETEKEELKKIYNLGVVVIPTNRPIQRRDLPDIIYKTESAKYRAVVNKIAELHQAGQPVLVGTVSIEVSETISRLLKQNKILHEVLNAKNHEREADIISKAGQLKSVTIATNMAGRGTDIKPSPEAREIGGLFVLGTGRHDSRRIDNQLRGRSGRQGDPGASQFFLSLEDNLLRVFGGERISKLMDRLQIDEDEPIEHVFITKAISNAQRKVEGHHFDIRKHVLQFDDVMEKQRSIIYTRRREILGDQVQELMLEMSAEVLEELFDTYCNAKYIDQWEVTGFNQAFTNIFGKLPDEHWHEQEKDPEEFRDYWHGQVEQLYREKMEYFHYELGENAAAERKAEGVEQQLDPEVQAQQFNSMVLDLERQVLLKVNDGLWKDHLLSMDHLREGISLVGYAQKKPLDEYKKQAFEMFSDLMSRINHEAVSLFYKIQVGPSPVRPLQEVMPEQPMTMQHGPELEKADEAPPKEKPVQKVHIGRNEPCPCGSGRKYKHCCGKTQAATAEAEE